MIGKLIYIGRDFSRQMNKKNISAFAASTTFFVFVADSHADFVMFYYPLHFFDGSELDDICNGIDTGCGGLIGSFHYQRCLCQVGRGCFCGGSDYFMVGGKRDVGL